METTPICIRFSPLQEAQQLSINIYICLRQNLIHQWKSKLRVCFIESWNVPIFCSGVSKDLLPSSKTSTDFRTGYCRSTPILNINLYVDLPCMQAYIFIHHVIECM